MYYLLIGFHPVENDGMESADKKVRTFLKTNEKSTARRRKIFRAPKIAMR